jgi:hypothetical protein
MVNVFDEIQAEIIPIEPDAGNAAEGKRRILDK